MEILIDISAHSTFVSLNCVFILSRETQWINHRHMSVWSVLQLKLYTNIFNKDYAF